MTSSVSAVMGMSFIEVSRNNYADGLLTRQLLRVMQLVRYVFRCFAYRRSARSLQAGRAVLRLILRRLTFFAFSHVLHSGQSTFWTISSDQHSLVLPSSSSLRCLRMKCPDQRLEFVCRTCPELPTIPHDQLRIHCVLLVR